MDDIGWAVLVGVVGYLAYKVWWQPTSKTCPPCEHWVEKGWEWQAGCYPIYPPPPGECVQLHIQRTGQRPEFWAAFYA